MISGNKLDVTDGDSSTTSTLNIIEPDRGAYF